ncbi:hypothetical protein ABPG72_009308 [Tetrahymena utriculariae]
MKPHERLLLTKYKNSLNEEDDVFAGNFVQYMQMQEIVLKILYKREQDEKQQVEKEIQIIRVFEQEYNRDILLRHLNIQNNHLILLNREIYSRIEERIDY